MNYKKVYPLGFLALAVIIYGVLYFLPSLFSFYYSMTDWNSFTDTINFIGLDNFRTVLFESKGYVKALTNTIWFASCTTILKNVIGLWMALMLNHEMRTKNLLRTIFYLPVTLSPLIVGLIFSSVLHPGYGVLNTFLRGIGLESLTHAWLVEKGTAMWSVIMVDVWKNVGFNMIIYIAGLQAIPSMYYEAARIDGGTSRAILWHITLPLLMPSISINLILNLINGFKVFDIVYILTKGGPGNLTEVLNTAVFFEFSSGRYGLSTAFGVVLLLIVGTVALLSMKILSRKTEVDL